MQGVMGRNKVFIEGTFKWALPKFGKCVEQTSHCVTVALTIIIITGNFNIYVTELIIVRS